MTDKNTPAFPGRPQQDPNDVNKVIHNNGMTIRDYFAGQSIGAIIMQCASDLQFLDGKETSEQYFARKAYDIADAMLAERDK